MRVHLVHAFGVLTNQKGKFCAERGAREGALLCAARRVCHFVLKWCLAECKVLRCQA
jgi:hypothetical protein